MCGRAGGPELETLTPEALIQAGLAFSETTGLGLDKLHPRSLAFLSRRLLLRLCALLGEVERSGCWEELWGALLVFFLSKPDGGFRPIVLFSGVVRAWGQGENRAGEKMGGRQRQKLLVGLLREIGGEVRVAAHVV